MSKAGSTATATAKVQLCLPAEVLRLARRQARADRRTLSGYVASLVERGDDLTRMERTASAGVGNLILLDLEVLGIAQEQAKRRKARSIGEYLKSVVRLDADITRHWEGEAAKRAEREECIERQIVGVWA